MSISTSNFGPQISKSNFKTTILKEFHFHKLLELVNSKLSYTFSASSILKRKRLLKLNYQYKAKFTIKKAFKVTFKKNRLLNLNSYNKIGMSDSILGFEKLSLRSYDFPLEPIPVLHWEKDRSDIVDLVKNKVRFKVLIRIHFSSKVLIGVNFTSKVLIKIYFSCEVSSYQYYVMNL